MTVTCDHCRGSGREPTAATRIFYYCSKCDGRGFFWIRQ